MKTSVATTSFIFVIGVCMLMWMTSTGICKNSRKEEGSASSQGGTNGISFVITNRSEYVSKRNTDPFHLDKPLAMVSQEFQPHFVANNINIDWRNPQKSNCFINGKLIFVNELMEIPSGVGTTLVKAKVTKITEELVTLECLGKVYQLKVVH